MQRADKDFVRVNDAEADARVSVPDADDLVVSCGSDEAAVVAELRAGEAFGVPSEFADAASGVNVPQPDAEISRTADDDVVAELDRVHGAGVAVEMAVQGTR